MTGTQPTPVTLLHYEAAGDTPGLGIWSFTTPFGHFRVMMDRSSRVPFWMRTEHGEWSCLVAIPSHTYDGTNPVLNVVKVGASAYPLAGGMRLSFKARDTIDNSRRFRQAGSGQAGGRMDRPISEAQYRLLKPVLDEMLAIVELQLPNLELIEAHDELVAAKATYERALVSFAPYQQRMIEAVDKVAKLSSGTPVVVA